MLNNNKHLSFMLKILKEIFTNPKIANTLGFKGGTMAMFFYDLPRFSVDLDFDLLKESDDENVYSELINILPNFGKIKDHYKKHNTIFFLLSYGERDHNIKIEINRRNLDSKYEVKNYLGISMNIITEPDMVAHKMCALFERYGKVNRDLFDVHFFLQKGMEPNEKIIRQRLGFSYGVFLEKIIKKIENNPPTDILQGLGELIDEKQKTYLKSKFVDDLLFLLKLQLSIINK